ncbi:unnamed protein product [Caenorhabditis nigoni]
MSTFYDLPKTSLAIFSADDPIKAYEILFSALQNPGFICQESCATWHSEYHPEVVVSTFSTDSELNPDDVTSSEVVFADFDLYVLTFGLPKALRLIKLLKNKKRIFIVSANSFPVSPHLEHLTNASFSIKSTENPLVFESSTTVFDKKGNLSVSDQLITIQAGGKPTFKTIKKVETPIEASISTMPSATEEAGKGAMDLPFFVGRQEDGVAIRDAATKKIRVGGQIVYEPDRDDDLDDSDPDDDLNI